jgi:uncharacterized membrane protein YqjE
MIAISKTQKKKKTKKINGIATNPRKETSNKAIIKIVYNIASVENIDETGFFSQQLLFFFFFFLLLLSFILFFLLLLFVVLFAAQLRLNEECKNTTQLNLYKNSNPKLCLCSQTMSHCV